MSELVLLKMGSLPAYDKDSYASESEGKVLIQYSVREYDYAVVVSQW